MFVSKNNIIMIYIDNDIEFSIIYNHRKGIFICKPDKVLHIKYNKLTLVTKFNSLYYGDIKLLTKMHINDNCVSHDASMYYSNVARQMHKENKKYITNTI